MRLIDADALERMVDDFCHKCGCRYDYYVDNIILFIKEAPTIEPERETGELIDTGSGVNRYWEQCDQCYEIQYGYDSGRRFCANCGAKMEGEITDE